MIKQYYRICIKCKSIGGIFPTRKVKLKTSKRRFYIDSTCAICRREEAKERFSRNYNDPIKKAKKRIKNKEYKYKNSAKLKKQNKIYYFKNKDRFKEVRRIYYINNKEKILKKQSENKKNRTYKLIKNIHIWNLLEKQRINKIINEKSQITI